MGRHLTTVEAAARLGVKPATLYSYVSRGVISRQVALDGKTSLFDSDEVEQLRSRSRRRTVGELDTLLSTELTRVGDDGLWTRGRDIVRFVLEGGGFEEAATWLWDADPSVWSETIPGLVAALDVQATLPEKVSYLDRLRATTLAVSAADPLRSDTTASSVRRSGAALLTAMVDSLPARREAGDGRLADRLWFKLAEGGTELQRRSLDAALALLADHGMAASTFAARVAASVRADPYSAVLAGLSVVAGPLHGATSGAVHRMLDDAQSGHSVPLAVGATLERDGKVPGFGHSVYRREDPRYNALMGRVNDSWHRDPRLATVHDVRDLVSRRTDAVANVDLALGAMTWLADMEPDAGQAIFAIARTAGWIAHALEEYQEQPGRFRPRARYVGPSPS